MTSTPPEYLEPGVRVSLLDIYNKVLDVERKVTPLPPVVADQEARLRIVERRMATMVGGAAVAGALSGALVSKLLG